MTSAGMLLGDARPIRSGSRTGQSWEGLFQRTQQRLISVLEICADYMEKRVLVLPLLAN